jgi:hypothetical protein|tara:strand:- start:689 stop:934 length:246 start_codon:yes stop_codon:yes gene_type:complete
MERELRKDVLKVLRSGHSAINIYSAISILMYKHISKIEDLKPLDFESSEYKTLKNDIERIIINCRWNTKLILNQLDLIRVV